MLSAERDKVSAERAWLEASRDHLARADAMLEDARAFAKALAAIVLLVLVQPWGLEYKPHDSGIQLRGTNNLIKDSRITESSGLAASLLHPGVLWTHNDSGNPPRIYAIDPDGSLVDDFRKRKVPKSSERTKSASCLSIRNSQFAIRIFYFVAGAALFALGCLCRAGNRAAGRGFCQGSGNW